MLKEAMKAAGFNSERLTAHSLRHTAGQTVMKVTGDNIYKTQLYMRHSSPTTTEIYLNNSNEEQDSNIAQRLYNLYHGIESQSDSREQLQQAIQGMTSEQIEQLTMFAKAISK